MLLRAAIASLAASTASADCPVAADLATGIAARQTDGTVEEFRAFGPGLVEQIARFSDGYTARNLLGQGVYVIELADLEAGEIVPTSRITSAYPVNADEMPVPSPGADWNVKVAMRDSDGFYREQQDHRWGQLTEVTYGPCTYEMIPGTLIYTGDGYSYVEEIHYLPALVLGLLVSFADGGDVAPEVYTYDTLRVMEPEE